MEASKMDELKEMTNDQLTEAGKEIAEELVKRQKRQFNDKAQEAIKEIKPSIDNFEMGLIDGQELILQIKAIIKTA